MALGAGGGGAGSRAIEAGRAFVRLGAKDDLTAHLKRIAGKFMEFGKTALKWTGVGGLIGGALGGLSFADTASDLEKMDTAAKAFGVSGRRMSGLFGLLSAAGGEFKENLEGVIQFSDTVNQALTGEGQGAKLFDGLAITAKEVNSLPIDEKFYSVLGAIRKLPQPLQEAKLALLGGTDSMKQWQRLLTMSEAEFRSIAGSAAVSSADLQQAAESSRAMEKAGSAFGRVWQRVVILGAPVVTSLANGLADALRPISEFMADRSIGDLWEELVARGGIAWEQLRFSGAEAWIEIKAAGKSAFIDLVDWLHQEQTTNFWSGLVVGAAVALGNVKGQFETTLTGLQGKAVELFMKVGEAARDPSQWAALAALPLAPAVGGAMLADAAKRALDDYAKQLGERAADVVIRGKDGVRADAEAEKAAARAGLNAAEARLQAVQDGVERKRNARLFAEFMDELQAPAGAAAAKQIGNALGTFGDGGKFLGQMFGGNGNIPKQQLDAQKKANAALEAIKKAVEGFQPLTFT